VLRRIVVVLLALVASPSLAATAREDPPDEPIDPPPPTESPVRVARVRCESLSSTRVLDPEVLRGGKGYVRFRIVLEYHSTLLYARRPGDHQKSYGRDFGPRLSEPPGVYHVRLPLEKGRWEVTCIREVRHSWVAAAFDEITVVR
jgi:hypothetical protein